MRGSAGGAAARYGPVVIDLIDEALVVRCGACGDERKDAVDAAGIATARAVLGRHAHCEAASRSVAAG